MVSAAPPSDLDDASTCEYPHKEHHSDNGAIMRDAIIGFADGLTVPFALTAGLSSIGNSKIVIVGGLAELFAGAISMGLGGYLACLTERKVYDTEEKREYQEIVDKPGAEVEEIFEIFDKYGLGREKVGPVVEELVRDKDTWVQFMMDFELRLEKPETSRAWISALTLAASYFMGGLLPMIPYFAIKKVNTALYASIGISIIILLVFGYIKAAIMGTNKRDALISAVQTMFVGVLAAGTSYGIVRGINEAFKDGEGHHGEL